ncbi:hypothetical protein BO85DRAFT_70749 [Aspergillus piperis CBS 112811]|uniref:Uncharacterized protein n=1 Tax=Aspergillus piperis CBS 112811 TaxID=1448313 RepID=A0A8G1QX15_9EURO|nr:hypothetical protein BO85DRAFT_70749 [Aspergillus piperis CBS 112811]RAH55438.1 hypothetical protein BO85DRAFT_70749 [Aspergillus piperis CBS 112811]
MDHQSFTLGASVIARPHSRSKGGSCGGYHIEMNRTPENGYSCITPRLVSDLHTVTVLVDKKIPEATWMGSPVTTWPLLAKQRRTEIQMSYPSTGNLCTNRHIEKRCKCSKGSCHWSMDQGIQSTQNTQRHDLRYSNTSRNAIINHEQRPIAAIPSTATGSIPFNPFLALYRNLSFSQKPPASHSSVLAQPRQITHRCPTHQGSNQSIRKPTVDSDSGKATRSVIKKYQWQR